MSGSPHPNGINEAPQTSLSTHTPVSQHTSWTIVAEEKVAQRREIFERWAVWHLPDGTHDSSITDVSAIPVSHLTSREREIVSQDVTGLAQSIRKRHFTAVEVIKAFCHVATIAQQVTNCLTEIFFEEGIKRAEELDKYLVETGKVIGPLHGVPVTIKDHIQVKDHDTSAGYIAWVNRTIATKDAVAVSILRKAGAVLYAKTSNPQTLLVGFTFLSRLRA